jgi:hypothetical protein
MEEKIVVSGFVNRALYNGYKNPLAQWLCSDEWTAPPALPKVRGMTEIDGMHTACFAGEAYGEIPWRKFDGLSRKFV